MSTRHLDHDNQELRRPCTTKTNVHDYCHNVTLSTTLHIINSKQIVKHLHLNRVTVWMKLIKFAFIKSSNFKLIQIKVL